MKIYYDQEGDYLEFQNNDSEDYTITDLGDGIFKKIDNTTKKTIGFSIHGFTQRVKNKSFELPFNIELIS